VRLIAVAVPVPGLGPLTYTVPDGLTDPPVGARVLVPLGKRVVTGVVTEIGGPASEIGKDLPTSDVRASISAPKPLIDILDGDAFLPAPVVQLASWVADYYACGLGEAIAAAMPPRAWIESERHARITDAGEAWLLRERRARRDVLQRLSGGRVVSVAALAKSVTGVHAVLASLQKDGLVDLTQPLKGAADASRAVRVATLTAQGTDDLPEARLGARQQQAIELLRAAPDGITLADFARNDIPAESLERLAKLGLVRIERRRVERDPFGASYVAQTFRPADEPAGETGPKACAAYVLTSEQQAAFETLAARAANRAYHAALLHGVTGSGKTEIYLRLARAVREAGRSVLLMVPEIALTPAVAAIFRAAFGARVAIQHSGLSEGERYDQWQRIRRGDVDVVVGTRSAVFTPLADLGLIVVDEEHDGSYKQEESPRYHGRDVAVVRARAAGALVVLGSATPSLESYANAKAGRYELIVLKRRVLDRAMADVQIVDMRQEYATEGPDVILSRALRASLAARLERGEQAMVLLNRRGFATVVFCRECGETLECPNCSVSLTVHKAAHRARCHYCNHSVLLPKQCGKCRGPFLEQLGFGTERIEHDLRALFPQARVARVDRDTMRRRGAIDALLATFAAGDLDVLVGTQMIAKGHDFPRVTLVGVISADVGLGLADFRAAERTFQLLTQVAGRSGRGERPGEAIVQTLYPNHYSIRHACRQDYEAFYDDELRFRQGMRYPPSVALINVVVKARARAAAMDDAGAIADAMRNPGGPWKVLGPAPAPLGRLKGEHRAQIFIKGTQRNAMRKALLTVLDGRPELKRRTIVDVDPMSVL
jgi:primosomal protein N' (replication factor Y) (superfamily II helicase)